MGKSQIRFGTDGWRALIAESFTFDNCELVAHAIGHYMLDKFGTQKPVVIGYDCRFLANKFAQLSADVMVSLGLHHHFMLLCLMETDKRLVL